MKGPLSSSPISTDSRHRLASTEDDTGKTKAQNLKVVGGDDRKFLFPESSSGRKLSSLKLALFVLACCMVLMLAFSPITRKDQPPHSSSGSRFGDVARIWQTTLADPRYISRLDVDWGQVSSTLEDIDCAREGNLRIGLLNFNLSEVRSWQQTLPPHAELSSVHLDHADTNLTWELLYPEWIDEEEESGVAPACPSLPQPRVKRGSESFDLVAVQLPCDRSGRWSRDVARLHLQLAAAKLAADSAALRVLLLTDCLPLPNLFTCRDLVRHEGNLWLYKPEPATLEEKLRLPVGSCELAIPYEEKVRIYTEAGKREAYATILHSAEHYVCGAIAAAQSLRSSGSARDLVILVDETISRRDRGGLEAAGWKLRTIERIRNPKAKRDAYNEWNYSKFRLWQLTDYDKVVFIDADLLVLRNIDFLFAMPEVSAVGNNATLFNSGVMLVEPSDCTFRLLMDHVDEITSYNGGDQGYLNEIFTWWHRVPRNMNFLKHFWVGDTERRKAKKNGLMGADPPALYVLHYLGLKPWLCFRDYDCNWNLQSYRDFASDAAHATWWRVHDTLPENLRGFCLLPRRRRRTWSTSGGRRRRRSTPTGTGSRTSPIQDWVFAPRSSALGRACCCIGARPTRSMILLQLRLAHSNIWLPSPP